MSQTVDIRELNERIESKSSFVNMITMGMDKVIVGSEGIGIGNVVIIEEHEM